MFASIRCYVLRDAPAAELARLVDAEFADQLASQPGFVWYVLLDCGDGDLIAISIFREREQAAGSRQLSQRFIAERLAEFDLTMSGASGGAIPVSRASAALLEPAAARFARLRSYRLADDDLGEVVWRVVDTSLAERMAELQGFVAYFVFSPGDGELTTVSVFADREAAAASDEVAWAFVHDELDRLDIERTDDPLGGGEILVSRVTEGLLGPIRR